MAREGKQTGYMVCFSIALRKYKYIQKKENQ
jgi:hypothetical protein